jgi:hypothetical protein
MSSFLKGWIGFVSVGIIAMCVLLGMAVNGYEQPATPTATIAPSATALPSATIAPSATTVPTKNPTVRPTATVAVQASSCIAEVGAWANQMSPVMELWSEAMTAGKLGLFNVVLDNSLRISAKLDYVNPPSCEPRTKQVTDLLVVANDGLMLSSSSAIQGDFETASQAMALVNFSQEEALRILNTIVADYAP